MKKITLFEELAEILKTPIAGVDFSPEVDDYKVCENCGGEFEDSDLNEYNLCERCEEFIQSEKKSINDTYDSLNISMR